MPDFTVWVIPEEDAVDYFASHPAAEFRVLDVGPVRHPGQLGLAVEVFVQRYRAEGWTFLCHQSLSPLSAHLSFARIPAGAELEEEPPPPAPRRVDPLLGAYIPLPVQFAEPRRAPLVESWEARA